MKKHFKMYKSGKQWCVVAIATLAMTFGLATTSHAADNSSNSSSQSESTKLVTSEDSSVQVSSVKSATDSSASQSSASASDQTASQKQTAASATAVSPKSADQSSDATDDSSTRAENKNGWVQDQQTKQWTYYTDGQVTSGRNYVYLPTIGKNDGSHNWYLVENGVALSGVQKWADTYYDFDPTTYLRVDNNYVQSQWGLWYMFGSDGRIATRVYQWAGTYYYFDPVTYLRVDNNYVQSQWGDWYLFGNDGRIQTGVQKWAGTYYCFDPSTYLRVNNDYRQSQWGDWYMFGPDGRIVTGFYGWKGSLYYFNPVTYLKAVNQTVYANGKSYWANGTGIITSGLNSINNYILNHGIGHANITFVDNGQYIPLNLTDDYSGTSDGKPNMVVVHETANSDVKDTIWSEINYEKNHYTDAFVHAFVDDNNIIQISNTDHEAWGAGYPANGRAVQFEQIEVHSATAFARELANAAYYTAYIMNKYGFAPSLAQSDGSGTLWSHHNVSQYLGGTNHTDPDGYWSTNARTYFGTSYSMSDFYELVSLYYGQLI